MSNMTTNGSVHNIHAQAPSSIYPALPLGDGDIRIISIEPEDDSGIGQVSCTLEVTNLEQDLIPYVALSYTWGPASVDESVKPATRVMCNGQDILVPDNLKAALLRIRDRPGLSGKKLWVDSISINQTDDEERSSQVQLMATIYSSAGSVLIWLGEEDKDTAQALHLIDLFPTMDKSHLADLTPHRITQSRMSRVWGGLAAHDLLFDPSSWDAVRKLFRRTYFRRVWIIQEVVLARRAVVLCGSHATSWEHLEALSHFLATSSWSSYFTTLSLGDQIPGPCHHNTPTVLKANKVSRREEGYAEALTNSLVRCRHFQAADARDKVYALFGLVGLGSTIHGKSRLRPEYGSRTVESAYISVAIQILEDSDDFLLLYCVEGDKFQCTPELPSWVPDWRCDKALGLRVTGYRRFNAAGSLSRRLVIHESSRTLEVHALKLDVISLVGEAKHEIDAGAPFPKLMGILKGNRSCTEEATLDAVWRSFLTDTGGDPPRCPIDESYGGAFVHWLMEKLAVLSESTPAQEASEYHAALTKFQQLSKSVPPSPAKEDYQTAFSHALYLRVFNTSEGYIGVGSECIEEDDSIWVVPGSRVPLVFRRAGSGTHRLAGGAYVHGIMHGEALRPESAKNRWETLSVV